MDSMELNSNVVGCEGGCTAIVDTGRRYLYQGVSETTGNHKISQDKILFFNKKIKIL